MLIVIQNIVCSDITLFYKNIMVSDKCLTQCGSKIKCIHKIFYIYWRGNMNQNKLPIIFQPYSFNFYLFSFDRAYSLFILELTKKRQLEP